MAELAPNITYINGALRSAGEAKISPFDHGFLYGYGLFETMRAYGGNVFLLDEHLDRLCRSARALQFREAPGREVLADAVRQTVQANGLTEARIRLTLSLGEGDMAPDPATCRKPTLLVMARQYLAPAPAVYRKGHSAVVCSVRRDSRSPLSRLKTCNYLASMLARAEARMRGVDEAVMLNEKGLLTECSSSNLFLVKDHLLYTPPVESGLLPGVTRQAVIDLAGRGGIELKVEELSLDSLKEADEAFTTNSIMEIVPLTRLEGSPIGTGNPGLVTKSLMTGYREAVEQSEQPSSLSGLNSRGVGDSKRRKAVNP
ncbi:MAG: aminotransferase class IV [Chloroflexi bacterium]|nr:aminotransferase class IV [Chloroflexota bacterium]